MIIRAMFRSNHRGSDQRRDSGSREHRYKIVVIVRAKPIVEKMPKSSQKKNNPK